MNNKKVKLQKEDVQSNRMAFFLVITFLAIMGLMYLYRRIESIVGLENYNETMWVLCGIFGAATVWGLFRLSSAKGKDKEMMLVSPLTHVIMAGAAALSCLVIRYYYTGAIKALYFLLPALCALYIIQNIYGSEFFAVGFFLLSSAGVLFAYYRAGTSARLAPYLTILAGLLLAYGVAFAVGTMLLQKGKGKISLLGKERLVVRTGGSYALFYVSAAVVAGVAVCYFITPVNAAYYGFFVLGGMLAICAAFYTYKLMYNE